MQLQQDGAGLSVRWIRFVRELPICCGRIASLVAVVLLLGACTSVKLGYENLPWLAGWQVNRYLDLDTDQKALVERQLTILQAWHRKVQLPDYADIAEQIMAEIPGPLTAEQVSGWRRRMLGHWPALAEQLAPMVAELGVGLRPEQLAHLRAAIDKANQRFIAEHRPDERQARVRIRAQRLTERAEGFLGRLEPAQQARIEAAAEVLVDTDENWWQARLARQARVVALLSRLADERPALAAASALAHEALLVLFAPQTVRVAEESDRLTVDLLALASPAQQRRAVAAVARYRGDFLTLAQRSRGSAPAIGRRS